MSDATPRGRTTPERRFNLSEIVGTPAIARGEGVGSVDELVIVDKGRYAEVTHLVVGRPFGRPPLVVPWKQIASFERERVLLDFPQGEPSPTAFPPSALLLKDYILDKKVIDSQGRDLEVVYDIGLSLTGGRLLVLDVDLSKAALFRRMHLAWLAKLATRSEQRSLNLVPWSYVEPLPAEISSFRGAVTLKVLKEQLAGLPAVDLADILEELGHEERMALFDELDAEQASDTLEALDPTAQRDLIASLDKAKAAGLIDAMTPAQAADLLAILPWWEVRVILDLLAHDKEKAAKIGAILAKQSRAGDFASANFLRFAPDDTVARVRTAFPLAARSGVALTYVYVVDRADRLVGVLDSKALLAADWWSPLQEIMTRNVVSLSARNTLRDASLLFARYPFRALPVIDDNGRMLGVLPYRDVVALRHRLVE